ncbi:MAG: PHP domain-containing protein [Candidatus Electrothrix sp. AR3]|nr:PHP domain-containing protein [Candidatus Electrothrix sp. AR3]
MCIDLHTHSVYSDGTATPEELIRMAASYDLKGFALTDHDTVEGVRKAMQLGLEHGVKVISGLEVSARHGNNPVHILGYGIDPANRELERWLGKLQQGRAERNRQIIEKLTGMGISVSNQEIEQLSRYGQTGRPHIARLLIKKGYVKNMNQAFNIYLGRNKPAWCRRFAYSATETIAIIHQAGGVAVLAHPGSIDTSFKAQPQIIRELAMRHLDGLEIYYPGHSRKTIKRLRGLARQHGLMGTGGSDYHGDNRVNGLAGNAVDFFCPPDSIMEELAARLHSLEMSPLNFDKPETGTSK